MSWIEDQNQKHKFARDYVILNGSFSNPEAGKKMRQAEDQDYDLSDEEWDQSFQRVIDDKDKVISGTDKIKQENQGKLRHRRRRLKKVIK